MVSEGGVVLQVPYYLCAEGIEQAEPSMEEKLPGLAIAPSAIILSAKRANRLFHVKHFFRKHEILAGKIAEFPIRIPKYSLSGDRVSIAII